MPASQPFMRRGPAPARPQPLAGAWPAQAQALPLPCLLPALASGIVLWMCYHPLSWGPLAWIALVPLLSLVRAGSRPRNIYFAAWAGGNLFFWAALQWMRVADTWMYAAWALLAVYCSLYFPVAVYLTRVLERRTRLPLVLTFPAVWVALEYVRTFLLTGFPWYFLAHSQHEFLTIIQITDLGGSFAVSFLVAAVSALLFDMLYQMPEARAFLHLKNPPAGEHTFGDDWPGLGNIFFASWRRGILVDTFAVGLLFGAAYLYGDWRLSQDTVRPGPGVALLQGNVPQRVREDAAAADKKAGTAIFKEYSDLCMRVLQSTPEVELLIWPETSYPLLWTEVDPKWKPDNDREFAFWRDMEVRARDGLKELAACTKTAQLLGISAYVVDAQGKRSHYNAALLMNSHGSAEARYDKMHRVPFGEYAPLREWFRFMDWFVPFDPEDGLRRGEKFTRFVLGKHRFGVLVCYEDTDPFLARHYVREEEDGPPVDFLVNISNDGWFHGSSEHEEHLAVSRFRAIECRRAMVRAVNMGISAVIDGNGRVLKMDEPLPDTTKPKLWASPFGGSHPECMPHAAWASHKHIAGAVVAAVPIDDRFSLYALAGDWLPGLCWLLIGIATIGVWVYRRFRPATQG